jgi:Aspartyl protease
MRLSLHGGAQHGQALVSPQARLVRAYRLPGGLISAPVELNGAAGLGVVDTGAARSIVNTRFAEAAGIDDASKPLGWFSLAGTSTRDVVAGVADAPTFAEVGMAEQSAMILGLDRLAGLKLIIDYPRRRIWFDPG